MKSKIKIEISVIDDGPVLMRCEVQNKKEMDFMMELLRRQGEVQP